MRFRNAKNSVLDRHRLGVVTLAVLIAAGAWQMSAALAYADLWWLRYVALVPLFVAIRFLSPVGAAVCGSFWGGLLFLFSRTEPTSGVLDSGWLLLIVIPAGFGWTAAEITRRRGFHPLLLGLLWAVVELIVAPLATRHGLLASTRGDGVIAPALAHFAGGYVWAALILAAINAFVFSALVHIDQTISGLSFVRIPVEPRWVLAGLCSFHLPGRIVLRLRPRAPPFRPLS